MGDYWRFPGLCVSLGRGGVCCPLSCLCTRVFTLRRVCSRRDELSVLGLLFGSLG